MRIENGALLRDQNSDFAGASGDSCFDTAECKNMLGKILVINPSEGDFTKMVRTFRELNLSQFIIDGKLQRHPSTAWMNDISSDQAHMYALTTGVVPVDVSTTGRTSNGDRVSPGYWAYIHNKQWLSNILLIGQMILFWIPIRWCDGNNPNFRLGPIKLNIGYRHWCGDYRLFKQSLYYAPWIVRRLVSKRTLKKMTRYYWEPEPNAEWLIEIDDKYIEDCL
jgi:hypothetical protein